MIRHPLAARILAGVAGWLLLLAGGDAGACSTFCLRSDEQVVFGKNYDWSIGQGLLVVNKRNVARGAVAGDGRPARWVSRHGSVTFNQFGRDFPSGGINEAGLIVEALWLEGTRYPAVDERPSLENLEWIQYQLDTAGSVAQVLASDDDVRIEAGAPLHYLVADPSGQVAAIEFLDGRRVAYTGERLPMAALTNTPYAASLEHLQRGPRDTDRSSIARFSHLADRLARFTDHRPGSAVRYAFTTLKQVIQGSYTQWSIVYESNRRRVHFRTADRPEIRTLDLAELDFSCSAPVLVLDLHEELEGDVRPALRAYAEQENLDLIRSSFAQVYFLADTPDESLVRRAAHPDTSRCLD